MTSRKRFVRTEPGERIDQRDFQQVAELSPRDAVAQPVDKIIQGDDATSPGYILSGFAVSTVLADTTDYVELTGASTIGTEVRVNRGVALLGFRDRGEVQFGCVISGGADTKTIDISAFPDAAADPYGVYVRFEFRDEDFQNRIFWNATAATPVEFPRSISTRRSEDWSMAIELTSPGPEWTKIAEVTKGGGVITAFDDKREFFFEGTLDNAYSVVNSEWGTTADRLADRALGGVQGFRRFVRAVQRQLQDIIGEDGTGATALWKDDPTLGATDGTGSQNLAQLNDNKLARDGSQTMNGDIVPDVTETHALGAVAKLWDEIYVRNLIGDQTSLGFNTVGSTADANALARETMIYAVGATATRTLMHTSTDIFTGGAAVLNVYRSSLTGSTLGTLSSFTWEYAFNASWTDAGGWVQIDATFPSAKVELSGTGLRMFFKGAGATTWGDILGGGTLGWDSAPFYVDNATGTAEAATKLTAPEVTAGTLLAGLGTISGGLTVGGTATASRLNLTAAVPATPLPETLYREAIPRAWGFIQTNAAGAFDIGGSETYNIDLASSTISGISPFQMDLKFITGVITGKEYSVQLTPHSLSYNPGAHPFMLYTSAPFDSSGFGVIARQTEDAALLDGSANVLQYHVTVFAKQT